MSIFDDLLGNTSAKASKAAAADTYAKQTGAISDLNSYGDQYAGKYAGLAQGYGPYVSTGYTANSALQNLLANPDSVRGLPGYQFAQDQGVQALDRSAAARGMLGSGRQSKDLLRFGTGLADQTYGNQLQRLMAASGQGQGALTAQNQTTGQGLQGQLATRQAGFGGAMNAAGTIGQGDVAAAQAQQSGITNLLSTGAGLLGSYFGAGGFGLPGSRSSSYKTYGPGN